MSPAQPFGEAGSPRGRGDRRRIRVRIEGTVQGVGFRPWVYRLAREAGLAGFVGNDHRGVLLELEGDSDAVDHVLGRLRSAGPPLAAVDRIGEEAVPVRGDEGFTIAASRGSGEAAALVTPDSATCSACLAELFDPADRRFRYPFVNCTDCGPRFTIVRDVPYDRPFTTMADFPMCGACRAEYEDPLDRRFHAQPNACPACGPSLTLARADGGIEARREEALRGTVEALERGEIAAVKGLGGFHLACRADSEEAVAALRSRKHREEKPFALMVASLEAARILADLAPADENLLASRERPIVLVPCRSAATFAPSVAPGRRELGLMLPYTPLHHLLLRDLALPLVMTSGNVSEEPIAYEDDDALDRLAGIADRFVLHDRPIEMRTDDSVARTIRVGDERRSLWIRRSRGAVPSPLELPVPAARPLLACGGQLKNTFCVAKSSRAWVSHHVGDLATWETRRSYREGIEHFCRLFAVGPEVVAHDLHPDYASTVHALAMEGVETLGVQHHHAHMAAVLAEHGETGPAIGVIYDGTGYGTDGTVWGGELLVSDLSSFERAGHLRSARLPGGDQAVRQPWRMACAWLAETLGENPDPPTTLRAIDADRWRAVSHLVETGVASPETTSMGRLFDAAASLAGVRHEVTHEGQAAGELEALVDPGEPGSYPFEILEVEGRLVLDPRPVIRRILADSIGEISASRISTRFHRGLAEVTVLAAERLARRRKLETVVLSGGVFQNRWLLESVVKGLLDRELRPLVPSRLPPNDGGLAFGQAAVAAARTAGAGEGEA